MENKERIITITVLTDDFDEDKIKELTALVNSANGEVIAEVTQKTTINPSTYIGSGKLEEVRDLVEANDIDMIVFNNELSGSQLRNIENIVDCKVIDRTGLILDIFATRARTKESKLQVKLAQLEYRLPRLVGFRKYLSREGAGIGTRGPGEQKLEVDRRSIEREISSIKNQLKTIEKKRETVQKKRKKSHTPEISLIGYTNAGKSTILNQLIELDGENIKTVYSDDRLFATLDTSVRKITYNKLDLIFSDTVGFITNLPDKLMDSFNSTFEEIELSDLILIVIDVSSVDYNMQINSTKKAIENLDINFENVIFVYNKIDLLDEDFFVSEKEKYIKISAKNKDDIKRLLDLCINEMYGKEVSKNVEYKYADIGKYERIKDKHIVQNEKFNKDGISAKVFYREKEVIEW